MQQVDFERLFQKIPSPHMVLDRSLNFVAVNPAYERAVMRSGAELVGRNLFEMFPNDGEGGRRLRASFDRVFESGESDTLAYIRYEIPSADDPGSFEDRYWTAVHTPLPDSAGHVRYLMQNTVDVTDMVRMREAMSLPIRSNFGEIQLIERAREAESANRAIQADGADFRRLFKSAPQMIAVLSGPEHLFTFANDACRKFIAHGEVVGSTVREAVPEVEAQGFIAMLDDVYRNAREHTGEAAPVMFHDESGKVREAFMDYSYLPIRDAEGRVSGVFFQGTDRTEAVRHMQRQRLLLDELNHRVKNTLASVQSIASQTLRSAPDLASARRDLEARIIALSKTHNLLSASSWANLDLSTIVMEGLAPYTEQGARISGPEILLDSKSAIAMAMLVHELAANAAQHGSLSVGEGRLDVSWRPAEGGADDKRLLFEWRESGGPIVRKPTHRGFGTRVLERVAEGELGGRLIFDYAPEGFFCQLDIPAANLAKVNNDAIHA